MGFDDPTYSVHEVYYDDEGKPGEWSEEPASPYGNTEQQLRDELVRFSDAMSKPVLDFDTGQVIDS